MRIIAGTARGREIVAPKGFETRPVTDAIREALFNIWQFDIEGSAFLDLFSGSGCMGLEALSRGAARVVMVDSGTEQVKTIRANLKKTKLDTCEYLVVKEDVFAALERLSARREFFDLIYADPPFSREHLFDETMNALGRTGVLAEGGVCAIRTPARREMAQTFGDLEKVRLKRWGISAVHFYQACR